MNTLIAPQIAFPVTVHNRKVTATIDRLVNDNPIHYEFFVSFSDGFADSFVLDEETGKIAGERVYSQPYAKALERDLSVAICTISKNFVHIFQHLINGVETNVWVIEKDTDPGDQCYGVYYNNHYRFELSRMDGETTWEVDTRSKSGDPIDKELADRVGLLLNSLL